MRPFSEDKLFEQGRTTDQFFATGSSSTLGEGGFETPLRNKVQIRMSFPVRHSVEMLRNSSSIYYYNVSEGQWNIPTRSINDHVGPFDRYAFPNSNNFGTRFVEDSIGFNSRGFSIASGSTDIKIVNINPNQSDISIHDTYPFSTYLKTQSQQTYVNCITKDFTKSIFRNSDYDALERELFTIPIDAPFLIEKIVIETPMYFGKGWFEDRTSLNYFEEYDELGNLYTGDSRHSGGPALTVSVMCQKNYGRGQIRDLIGSEIITHVDDYFSSSVVFEPTHDLNFAKSSIRGFGKNQIASEVSNPTVISTNEEKFFSGTVVTKMVAAISNGLNLAFQASIPRVPTSGITAEQLVKNLLSSEKITAYSIDPLPGGWETFTRIIEIDPLGRGMTGFSPSGGSIFGKEYCALQNEDADLGVAGEIVRNPFYTEDPEKINSIIADYSSYIASASPKPISTLFTGEAYHGTKQASPYLTNPGDKLILAISKKSPLVKLIKRQLSASVPEQEKGMGKLLSSSFASSISDGIGHDVQLASGTINVTFYGSYVKENKEYIP